MRGSMGLLSAFGRTPPGQFLRWGQWNVRSALWRRDRRYPPNLERLAAFNGRHQGERCFIIGNGPSLKEMDLEPLRDEVTFGLNRIYLLFPKLGFETTYLVAVNKLVIEQCAEELAELTLPRFLSWNARGAVLGSGDGPGGVQILHTHWRTLGFSEDPTHYLHEGATVTFVAMQLAFYMGFRRVVLIGVDHSFATRGTPHKAIVSQGDDPNHFDPSYFGKGFRWQLPDLETSELAYALARDRFERDGREIVDATVGGKLEIFPKVEFGSLF